MAEGPGPALCQTSLSLCIIGASPTSQFLIPLKYKGYKAMPSAFVQLAQAAWRRRRCEPHTTCHTAETGHDALQGAEFPTTAETPPAIRPLPGFPKGTLSHPCCIASETRLSAGALVAARDESPNFGRHAARQPGAPGPACREASMARDDCPECCPWAACEQRHSTI
jgi:hypothetical protein